MALTQETVIDKIEITEMGHVHVRQATYFLEDGQRVSGPQYHRRVLAPGDDVTDQDVRVQRHAAAAWTPEVVAAEQSRREERQISGQ